MTDGQGKPRDGFLSEGHEGKRNFTQCITSHLRYNPALTQVGKQFLFWKVGHETLLCCR
jgi:hypothetical protein